MFATTDTQIFGPIGERGVEVELPKLFYQPSVGARSCAVLVNTRGPLDTSSWYEVWAGANAIMALCVSKSVGGISTGQGMLNCLSKGLFICANAACL